MNWGLKLWALPLCALVLGAPGLAAEPKAKAKTTHAANAKKVEDDDAGNSDDAKVLATESEHLVKIGETLGGIAQRAKVPRILIAEANGLKPPYHVHAGQKLLLPRTRRHVVKEGETGFDIAYKYGVPFSAIAVANGLKPNAELKVGQKLLIPTVLHRSAEAVVAKKDGDKADKADSKPDTADDDAKPPKFLWPVEGKVRRGFAPRDGKNYHDGIDIIAKPDTAVRATAAGKVLFAGDEPQSFGRLVVIDHGGGWQSAYGFLGKMTVTKGDKVKARERIGLVGHSGKATADELHFELRKANKPVDPADLLAVKAKVAQKAEAKVKPDVKAKKKPVKD